MIPDEEVHSTASLVRTIQTIESEYSALAKQLGDRIYKIDTMTRECMDLKSQMLKLNQESFNLQAAGVK